MKELLQNLLTWYGTLQNLLIKIMRVLVVNNINKLKQIYVFNPLYY